MEDARGGDLAAILAREDHAALSVLAASNRGRVLRYLVGRLSSVSEEERRRAVRALGGLARDPALLRRDAVLDLLRRFLWALNDESGAVPWGVPEAMGEVLASRPEFQEEFLPILCGMLTEEEALQTGAVERGVIEALGRIGPAALLRCPGLERVLEAAAAGHPDAATREEAARALAALLGTPRR